MSLHPFGCRTLTGIVDDYLHGYYSDEMIEAQVGASRPWDSYRLMIVCTCMDDGMMVEAWVGCSEQNEAGDLLSQAVASSAQLRGTIDG